MNIDNNQQYFLLGHTDTIQCIAYNENKGFLCTGQRQSTNVSSGAAFGSKENLARMIIWDVH